MNKKVNALVAVAALTVVSCGATAEPTTTTVETTTTTEVEVLEVRGVDYGYAGLPAVVESGTEITFINESDSELHELVAIRLPDDEERTVEELVASPDLADLFPSVSTVILAPPGSDGIVAVGEATFDEPGRYAVICAIPTGADPDEYMAAAAESEGGPPEVDGGPPHFVNGMFAEVVVEG